jgi:hypothetical protein
LEIFEKAGLKNILPLLLLGEVILFLHFEEANMQKNYCVLIVLENNLIPHSDTLIFKNGFCKAISN